MSEQIEFDAERDTDFNKVWKAISSVRNRFNDNVLETAKIIIKLESRVLQVERDQNRLSNTLQKIENTLEQIRDYQSEQKAVEKANAKIIAFYSAIGGGGGSVLIGTAAKLMGVI